MVSQETTIAARYHMDTGPNIAHNTLTIVDFTDKNWDTHNMVTTGAAWHFTAPVPGFYEVKSALKFDGMTTWADGEQGYLAVYRNGLWFTTLDYKNNFGNTNDVAMQLSGSDILQLAKGDRVDIRAFQFSGSVMPVSSFLSYVSILKV
jgi:hypothetical protein